MNTECRFAGLATNAYWHLLPWRRTCGLKAQQNYMLNLIILYMVIGQHVIETNLIVVLTTVSMMAVRGDWFFLDLLIRHNTNI